MKIRILYLPDGRWCATVAVTLSEARAQAKNLLGLQHLPPGIKMEEL